jgi:hypothetical protein
VHLRRQRVQAGDAVPRAGEAIAMHGRLLRAEPAHVNPALITTRATKLPDVSHAYLTPEWPS